VNGSTTVERFENRIAQVAFALLSALIGLTGLAMVAGSETRGSGVFFLVLGEFFAVRATPPPPARSNAHPPATISPAASTNPPSTPARSIRPP
jgi:hypothetical protein